MVIGEMYHCYNRGVDKRTVFEYPDEYERFLTYLFLSNGRKNLKLSDFKETRLAEVLANERLERGGPLVEVGAYALMSNHFHLILKEIQRGGIATFMQKVMTGYTMYFNNKRKRTGALFAGTFKSKHLTNDRYLKQALPYVLMNPIELFEHNWKKGIGSVDAITKKLTTYPYASFSDFFGHERPEKKIVTLRWSDFYDRRPSMHQMLTAAQEYYEEQKPQV